MEDPKNHRTSTSYWMGQVDTTLRELVDKFNKFIESDHRRWEELRTWQGVVERRLADGTEKFSGHAMRLDTLETKAGDPDKIGIMTFPWVRDKLLIPAVNYMVVLAIAYVFGKITGIVP